MHTEMVETLKSPPKTLLHIKNGSQPFQHIPNHRTWASELLLHLKTLTEDVISRILILRTVPDTNYSTNSSPQNT